jgi:hypothetical protein
MHFIVPWVPGITDQYCKEDTFVYYQAVKIPVLQGGRQPHEIGNSALSIDQVKEIIEKLGNRFRVLANSCFPEWSPDVYALCTYLDSKKAGIVVANMKFAQEVRERFPNIRLHSSVIMNFYNPLQEILESPLFDTVGGPEFNSDDTNKMIADVPKEHRKRVFYVLESSCVWTAGCKRHYELPSLQYKYPDTIKEKFCWTQCCGKKGAANIQFEKLLDAGFELFKFEGRTLTLEAVVKGRAKYLTEYENWNTRQTQLEDK